MFWFVADQTRSRNRYESIPDAVVELVEYQPVTPEFPPSPSSPPVLKHIKAVVELVNNIEEVIVQL